MNGVSGDEHLLPNFAGVLCLMQSMLDFGGAVSTDFAANSYPTVRLVQANVRHLFWART